MADLDKFRDELENIEQSIRGLTGTITDNMVAGLTKSVSKAKELVESFDKGKNITRQVAKQVFDMGVKNEISLLKEESLRKKINKAISQNKDALANALATQLQQIKAERKINEQLEVQLRLLDKINEEHRKLNDIGEVSKRMWNDFIKPFKEMFTIYGLLKIFFESAIRFSKISTDIGKNLGYGADNANKLANNFVDIAQRSTNLNVTLANIAEAMNEISSSTGFVTEYSKDTLETQIMLTKQFGLTADEAANIYKFSILTGKSSSKINDEMVGTYVATRNSLKVGVPFRQVMAEAAKISGQLAINLGYSPERITKAVIQAKALGTTLEQTKAQAESLLNWESSIENELKAELLVGQQMNLERARAAALLGDQELVMKELVNQGMTLEKFSSMNVIAQKSFAEALGLSADQLSDQLTKQKLAQESGKSLAEITKEEALEAEKRQNIQDKFNAAVLKLQDILGNLVAGPLGMLLDGLGNVLDIIGYIMKPFIFLQDLTVSIAKTLGGWSKALGPFSFLLKGIAGIAILLAAYGAFAALSWIPVVGPILGAAAAIAVTSKGFSALSAQKAGDIISPAEGKTQISTKEGGLFELSKNDDLIAGPGLASKTKSNGTANIDLTPMINAINQVKASVDRLYNKDMSIDMDGKKVGTTLSQGSYKVA